MKKILYFFICLTIVSLAICSNYIPYKPLAEDIIDDSIYIDTDSLDITPSEYGFLEEDINQDALLHKKKLLTTGNYNSTSFSLLNENRLPSVKNQESWRDCWSFAAISSIESNYMSIHDGEPIDLSETKLSLYSFKNIGVPDKLGLITNDGNNVVANQSATNIIANGGNGEYATFSLMSGIGVVEESDFPRSAQLNDESVVQSYYNSLPFYDGKLLVNNVDWISMSESQEIKKSIVNNGAIMSSYYSSQDYFNNASYFISKDIVFPNPKDNSKSSSNHAITIIGWDDNYPKENFVGYNGQQPSANGAWLVRNSWGSTWGENGNFWISYEERSLLDHTAFNFSFIDYLNDYRIYQYDGSSVVGYLNMPSTFFISNIFISQRNENIEYVSFASASAQLRYSIYVYSDVPENSIKSEKLLLSQSGTINNAGYHSIKLNSSVFIPQNTKFSIVIKITSMSGETVRLPIDYSSSSNGINFVNNTDNDFSYYSYNDETYYTAKANLSGKSTRFSFRIKAISSPFYSISYVLDDDVVSNNPSGYIPDNPVVFEDAEKPDFVFGGWYTDQSLSNRIQSTTGFYQDLILYPKWISEPPLVILDDSLKNTSFYVDGTYLDVTSQDFSLSSIVDSKIVNTYNFNTLYPESLHQQYPISMKTYFVEENEAGQFKTVYMPELDDILTYSGVSIRTTGQKGIRIITSIPTNVLNKLLTSDINGYNVVEYGTILCWSSSLQSGEEPTLIYSNGDYIAKYGSKGRAYSKAAGINAIFKQEKGKTQYTNTLVGNYSDAQCASDFAMRPYMILRDISSDNPDLDIVIYGGTLYRSISYVAYQNRNSFSPTTQAYEYIWGLIRAGYGNQYDSEYRGNK